MFAACVVAEPVGLLRQALWFACSPFRLCARLRLLNHTVAVPLVLRRLARREGVRGKQGEHDERDDDDPQPAPEQAVEIGHEARQRACAEGLARGGHLVRTIASRSAGNRLFRRQQTEN